MSRRISHFVFTFVLVGVLVACVPGSSQTGDAQSTQVDPSAFHIVAGSEVKALESAGVFTDFAEYAKSLKGADGQLLYPDGVKVQLSYKGSVDIKNSLARLKDTPNLGVDAYWPASSLWLAGSVSPDPVSIARTYIVLAVRPDVAKSLSWSGNQVTLEQVLDAIRAGQLNLAMTSASQSNSGASFYLASLSYLCGKPVLASECLSDPSVTDAIKTLLGAVDRPSESSGNLKTAFVADYTSGAPKYGAMVNYESLVIEANQELVNKGVAPLNVFYVEGATAIADEPLRYADNGSADKKAQYSALVAYLQTPEVQAKIQSLGWRTGLVGMALESPDEKVFNPAWGIDTETEFQSMTYPKQAVIEAALVQYQSAFRKPSFTVYCLDFSGSMNSNGGEGRLHEAMNLILDQSKASEVLLQAGPGDYTLVYGFNEKVYQIGDPVSGNDTTAYANLAQRVEGTYADSGTNIFGCAEQALAQVAANYDQTRYNYAVVVMTDGASNAGPSASDFVNDYRSANIPVPFYGITFGSGADASQLKVMTDATGGVVYDGSSDLVSTFKKVKGNN